MNIIGGIGHLELQSLLQQHQHLKIDGWSINLVGNEIWLSNPYGIDVGFYENDAKGCERITQRIASEDREERERGTL